jgi:hypothetical protein
MRDFQIHDIPARTGYDEWRARQQFRARVKTALGWVFLLSLSAGIGALIALTTFPR